MLSFRRFITETKKFTEYKYANDHHHIHDMGDHEIHVTFSRDPPHDRSTHRDLKGNNHWRVNFDRKSKKSYDAERTYHRGNLKNKSAKERGSGTIAVKRSVDHFITKHKPKSLEMDGNTERKKAAYSRLANHLAKRHGGKRHLTGTEVTYKDEVSPRTGRKYKAIADWKQGTGETSRVVFPKHKDDDK